MTIKEIKKELGLSQKDIAEFFDMTYSSFSNSTARKRYEQALCRFYEKVKEGEGQKRKRCLAVQFQKNCELRH